MPSRRGDNTLVFKIVFWGPTMGGKTTALEWIYRKEGLASGKLQSIADPTGRTLFFDRVVARVSNVVFQTFTVAGQRRHKYQRKTVLKGSDSLIFVWDSSPDVWEENIWSFKELLRFYGPKVMPKKGEPAGEIPLIFMANKRDLPNITPVEKIREVLNKAKLSSVLIYETIAITGVNVKRAFVYAAREAVLKHYMKLKGTTDAPKAET
ncbi:MAG: ADP-ribosylation factor-like protein [Promethearchaeota archaeon]